MAHKTKQAALKAARKDLGEAAVEGMDFTLRNTGAGWICIKIPPANVAAEKAQAARGRKPQPATKGARAPKRKPKPAPPAGMTKTDLLVGMMKTPEGATSKAMEEATSWAPHSVRGLVGMLKKRGVPVESHKEPGQPTRYRIARPSDDIGDVI